jgi:hypothetical protein
MSRFTRIVRVFQTVTLLAVPALALAASGQQREKHAVGGRLWGSTVNGMALSIATEKDKYALGEEILLNVLLKNVGDKEASLWEEAPAYSYKPSVLLPDGKACPLTPFGKSLLRDDSQGISSSSIRLKSGEMACVEFVMNRLYDFTRNGKYKVSVRRINVLSPKGDGFEKSLSILSNTLEITVDNSLGRYDHPANERHRPAQEHIWLTTLEDLKIVDYRFNPRNRVDAATWLGKKKSVKAVPILARGVELIVYGNWTYSSAESELAAVSLALGQIAEPKGLPAVKKACDHLSSSFPTLTNAMAIPNLFTAYRGMALLGRKKEALAELKRIYEKQGAKMEPARKAEYEKQLSAAATW